MLLLAIIHVFIILMIIGMMLSAVYYMIKYLVIFKI